MTFLVLGLLLFLGSHSLRMLAPDWRGAQVARLGENGWKGALSLAAAIGLGLTIWGFGIARAEPVFLWQPPLWTRHAAALLTLPAFVLIVAAYLPGSRLKAVLGHPMLAGTVLWAGAHLLANGRLHDLILFGAFLAWAAVDFGSARRRDRDAGVVYPPGSLGRDGLAALVGVVAWAAFAGVLHGWLIGVRPFA